MSGITLYVYNDVSTVVYYPLLFIKPHITKYAITRLNLSSNLHVWFIVD